MNDAQALEIVSALASGLDPTTAQPVDGPSIIQNADVIRALYVAIRALESASRSRTRSNLKRIPANAGKTWTEEEDRQLLERYDAGQSVVQLAQAHDRTLASIHARLERNGRVQGQGLQLRGRGASAEAGVSDGDGSS